MEINDLLNLIGFEAPEGEEPQIDSVRDYVQSNFVTVKDLPNRKDLIDPLLKTETGKRMGSLQTTFISSAKKLGLDVSHADFKDKQLEDLMPTVFAGVSEIIKAKPKGDAKLEEELGRIKGEYQSLKEIAEGYPEEREKLINEFATKETNWKKDHAVGEAWKTISYKTDVKDLEKRGFEASIKDTYDSLVGEDGSVYPVFKSGEHAGRRVPNPAKVTEHLKWGELLSIEAKKAELLPAAHDGKQTKPAGQPTRTQQPAPRAEGARRVNPRAEV